MVRYGARLKDGQGKALKCCNTDSSKWVVGPEIICRQISWGWWQFPNFSYFSAPNKKKIKSVVMFGWNKVCLFKPTKYGSGNLRLGSVYALCSSPGWPLVYRNEEIHWREYGYQTYHTILYCTSNDRRCFLSPFFLLFLHFATSSILPALLVLFCLLLRVFSQYVISL